MEVLLSVGAAHFLDEFASKRAGSRGEAVRKMLQETSGDRVGWSTDGPWNWEGWSAYVAELFHRKDIETERIKISLPSGVARTVRETRADNEFPFPYNPRDKIEAAIRLHLGMEWKSGLSDYGPKGYGKDRYPWGTVEADRDLIRMSGDPTGILGPTPTPSPG